MKTGTRVTNLYERFVLPKLVHAACGVAALTEQRAKVVPAASGRVLEIGCGSGLNLPLYDRERVEHIWALEPSREMWAFAREHAASAPFPVEHVLAPAEEMPLADASVDTVLVTYTLCTIPDVARALAQVRRVLKKGGRLLFCEHGAAPDEDVLRWQHRLNPLWSRLAGGCQLTRRIPDLLERNGFEVRSLSRSGFEVKPASQRKGLVPLS